ncbi:hypothetical protein [Sphingomonas sp. ERG5]|uniref:hypothetical protein n=1 Tax=Sphingomonas sp. ERG5 TaxID=1381597 RepID=UPI00054B09B8|nr:hypothetical protein [Sphingomonas sp. ERG5]
MIDAFSPADRHASDTENPAAATLARIHARAAIGVLAQTMTSRVASDHARVAAGRALLDQGFGRPEPDVGNQEKGESFAEILAAARQRVIDYKALYGDT